MRAPRGCDRAFRTPPRPAPARHTSAETPKDDARGLRRSSRRRERWRGPCRLTGRSRPISMSVGKQFQRVVEAGAGFQQKRKVAGEDYNVLGTRPAQESEAETKAGCRSVPPRRYRSEPGRDTRSARSTSAAVGAEIDPVTISPACVSARYRKFGTASPHCDDAKHLGRRRDAGAALGDRVVHHRRHAGADSCLLDRRPNRCSLRPACGPRRSSR